MTPTLDQYTRAAAARLGGSDTPQLDARVIVKHAFGLDDAGLILEAGRELTAEEVARLDALVARRAAGEPVAYIVGEKEFWGLSFRVASGVLVPRPDSETLIEAAARRRPPEAALRILDLGTGTGCLVCALLRAFPNATGIALDRSETAARLARANARRLGLAARLTAVCGDWGAPIAGRFDLVVSNPPYIPEGDREKLAAGVRDHEDPAALFAGPDGLDAYRRILGAAPDLLADGGLMILELGERQDGPVAALARGALPQGRIAIEADLAGRPRALVIDLA
ncbi:peptide chain release factor N(5)-glutamine methyltransferase [Amphiplicatus metriothermophilus]|uniref:Release factor glutamine methyltransferase n=1 Tax=Amphiplicatus metriothermophilus TaxID=1519374 RepID=A0A239PU49_9PROT|nr:peptide chain release factor N(5)-glutamine methyltransferase [Amphiplicatus metriothermophilus]MBB5519147.1 release factor glutamine methyltransferase [Amphiplicatus metriothermophilus]SNT73217.1 release factor glutamine methyltransferase [Amphiplicatus metriothermophilus]